MRVLGIGLDYKWLTSPQTRGGYRERLSAIGSSVVSMKRIVFCPKSLHLKNEVISDNIEIIYTNSFLKANFPFDALRIAKKVVAEGAIDVISAEDPFLAGVTGLLLGNALNLPVNVQIHDDRIGNEKWLKEHPKNTVLNNVALSVIKRCDTVRVVSNRVRDNLTNLGIKREKMYVVPTLINTHRFANADGSDIKMRLLGGVFSKIILFVGRLSPEKDLPTLIQAYSIVAKSDQTSVLAIVGGGPEEQHLKQYVEQLGVGSRVMFVGPIPHDDIHNYFAAADIFVLSSRHEGRGDVLVEAGLAGNPLISTKVGDSESYIVDGQTGYLVDIGDYNAIATKISFFLNNENCRRSFAEKTRELITERLKIINNPTLLVKCWKDTKTCKRCYP